nr:hypothetical protein [Microctonus hyperodae filamentous virus]
MNVHVVFTTLTDSQIVYLHYDYFEQTCQRLNDCCLLLEWTNAWPSGIGTSTAAAAVIVGNVAPILNDLLLNTLPTIKDALRHYLSLENGHLYYRSIRFAFYCQDTLYMFDNYTKGVKLEIVPNLIG